MGDKRLDERRKVGCGDGRLDEKIRGCMEGRKVEWGDERLDVGIRGWMGR